MNQHPMFIGMTPSLRLRIETTIENLLALLDEIDGDESLGDTDEDTAVDDERCDFSDSGDDEPGLGRFETIGQGAGTYTFGVIIDGELSEQPT